MGIKGTVCLVLIAALFAGCRGQAFSFNASAIYTGSRIILSIQVTAGDPASATFECQLDNGPFAPCNDGFEYTSVAAGTHFVTVRGALNGLSGEATLGPLTSVPELSVATTVAISGTTITLTIVANQEATFECRLDDEEFVPCSSGFQFRGVSAGQHTVTVRATSTSTGLQATATTSSFNVDLNAIFFSGIRAMQNIDAQTVTFTFAQTENFPTRCSIDGGPFVACSSPYLVNVSSLSSGIHNITFNAIVDGVVRGSATQSFIVSEGVLVEFREASYSVIEDVGVFNVTLVKQGDPGQNVVVNVFPISGSARFPSDYNRGALGRVTFTPGGPDEMTIQLRVLPDGNLELNETFTLGLQLIGGIMTQLGPRNRAEVTIINDDSVQVFFPDAIDSIDESSRAIIPVTFTPQTANIPFTFIVETFDLTPPDARAGVDYQPIRRNVTLSGSRASRNLIVNFIDDQITERTERFGARIIIPPETQRLGVELGPQSTLEIGILDDDFGDDLEIICSTNLTGDAVNGRTLQLSFEANQDATFTCGLNTLNLVTCTSPTIFMNVDISQMLIIRLEGTTTLRSPPQTLPLTKNVFAAMGGLEVVGVGAVAVQLEATKSATYRCRLNDGEYVSCVDGQVFSGLAAGRHTLFIEATAVDNVNEVAYDAVGPVVIVAGVGASASEAIAACLGSQSLRCDSSGQNCEYTASWRIKGDHVDFTLMAQTSGWVGIGFSTNNVMPNSDIIVGAVGSTGFFVDDRFATNRDQPPRDIIQNVDNPSASFDNGVTTISFSRDKITNDTNQDIRINRCLYFLFAWSGNADINTGDIQYHGSAHRNVSEALFCLPSATFCPERFDCGDPGTPGNGSRVLTTDTLEGSTVSFTCDAGFRPDGTGMTRECVLSPEGIPEWTESVPDCLLDSCGSPGVPINGQTFGNLTTVGSIVNHTCNEGYVINGASQRECLPDGSWSAPLPLCDPVNCGNPGEPANGDTIGTTTTLNSSVTHICDRGYVLSGARRRVCLPNGTWSQPLPSCVVTTVEIINSSITVVEGDSALVCVERNGAPLLEPFTVVINPSVFNPPEATPNVDYDQNSKDIVFNPDDEIKCVEVDTLEDTTLEIVERFLAVLILPADTLEAGVTPGARTETPISITDDDEVLVCLKNDSYTVTEGGDVTVGIQINRPAGTSFSVTLTPSPGTATVSDYIARTETVTFAPTQTMAFVTFSTRDDEIVEGNEVFTVTLDIPADAASLGVQKKSPDVADITIIDDNDVINVRFEEPEYSGDEPDEMVEVCLLKDGENSINVRVTLTPEELTPASADGGVDFSTSNIRVTFRPGQTRRCVNIPFSNDNIPEGDEMFNVEIRNTSNVASRPPSTTKITIIDDDRGIEFVNGSNIKVNEEQGSTRICIRRTATITNAMTVLLDYTSIIATGTADFDVGPSQITFSAGERTACFDVPILEDDITEGDNEIFEIIATPSVGGTPVVISVCIRDNDNVIFEFTEPEYSGNETDKMTEVCIVKIGRNEIPVTVTFTSIISTTADNPAQMIRDFDDYSISITYERGSNGDDNIRCIEVPLVNDEDIEPTEEFVGKLTTNDSASIPDDEVPINIIDDDGVRVRFKKVKYFITEGDSPLELCLEKLGTVTSAVTVAVSSSDGSASAPSDYTAVSNFQITFQPDETMKCFEMNIINNNLREETENFSVTVSPVAGNVTTVEPTTTCVMITDDDVTRVCRMVNMGRVFPFSQTGSQTSYVLSDVCEHTILTTCRDSDDFTINIDYSEGTLNIDRVGIKYNASTIVMVKDPMSVELKGLGEPISQSGQVTEYPNQIFITQSSTQIDVNLSRLGVRVTCTSSELRIETSSGELSGDLCGLCGRLNGHLVYSDRTTVADITDQQDILQFTNSWRALPLDMFLRDEARKECGMNANDTIIGDPLFTVPIQIPQELITQNPNLTGASLCYEIHGRANSYFNLVSDKCTSVNAFYVSLDNALAGNIIGGIGVNAVDQDGVCHRIEARLDQCSAFVDGDALSVGESYNKAGIIVSRRRNRVRIAIPNCGNIDLVLWFICQSIQGQMMSRFVIARGVNLQPTSHGLVGQFWNVPIEVSSFPVDPPALPHYEIKVNGTNRVTRSFVGKLYERTWDATLSPCLYVGNRQGGPSGEFEEPNDSVLQGSYQDYEVSSLFSTDFVFSEFDSDTCGF